MKHHSQRDGFSLLELVVVLAITGGLTMIVLPRLSGSLHQHRAEQAAHRIIADLSLAKTFAVGSNASLTVTFNVASNSYSIPQIKPLDKTQGTYGVFLGDDPYRSKLVSVWGQTGTQTLTFDGRGMPTIGGNLVVSSGGVQKTIVIDAASGTMVFR